MKSIVSIAILGSAFIVACQKSPEKKVDELAEAQQTAAAKAADARQEADVKSAKAYNEADQKIAQAQQNVNEKANEVAKDMDAARQDLRNEVEQQLGSVDKRIVDLNTKIATAKSTKAPRSELENTLHSLQAKSASLHKDIPEIQTAAAASFGNVKSDFESRITEIKKSLDDLERKV